LVRESVLTGAARVTSVQVISTFRVAEGAAIPQRRNRMGNSDCRPIGPDFVGNRDGFDSGILEVTRLPGTGK